jgi:hypothetical protein
MQRTNAQILFALSLLASVALLAGCKSNVDRANEMADAVCACTTKECAEDADKKGADEMLKHLPRSMSDDDKAKLEAAKKRSSDCFDKLLAKK